MSPEYTEAELDGAQAKARPRGVLPRMPSGRDPAPLQQWLTRAFRPPEGYHADAFERHGRQRLDPCTLTFRNGRDTLVYRFAQQGDLIGPKLRSTVVAISDGELAMPHLTGSEIEDVWAALCTLGRVLTDVDDRDEIRKWLEQMIDVSHPIRGFTLVPDGRHEALMAMRDHGEFTRPDALALARPASADGWARRPVRFVDEQTQEQFVRAGETAAFVRWVCGKEPLSHSTLQGRLHQIGVEARRFEDYRPPHPKMVLFRLSEELVEWVEASAPAAPATAPATPASATPAHLFEGNHRDRSRGAYGGETT
jgi:hypothetical protein